MEKTIKIILFIVCIGYLMLDLTTTIPPMINNFVYGIMGMISLVFLFLNRKDMGLNNETLGLNNALKKTFKDTFKK